MRADFLNLQMDAAAQTAPIGPAPAALNVTGLDDDRRFFNRELSWLAFNWRVLEEADNRAHPLMERVRFLSISASNLDEFYMVRVAGLMGLAREGVKRRSLDGRTPLEQLREVEADARRLMAAQLRLWTELRAELAENGVQIVEAADLTQGDRAALQDHFLEQVFPVLTPLAIDPAHPFPFIPNKGFAQVLSLKRAGGGEPIMALIPIPAQVARFIRLPAEGAAGPEPDGYEEPVAFGAPPPRLRFCALETLIDLFLDRIFPGCALQGRAMFRILRDSDIELEEEAEDLVAMFETALKRRRRGDIVRLKIQSGAPQKLSRQLIRQLEAPSESVIEVDGLIGISAVNELIDDRARPDLCFPPYTPRMPERLRDFSGDVFAAIREKDMLLHHPYESFEVVVRFLQQAAQDPNVVAIRQTLYRTSKESPIVSALVEAAEAGKSVTALVELKARFDEAANIRLAKILERAGCQVIYGFVDYKTHAKMSTVVRREDGELVTYSHFGTGNYHPITAKVYTDLSLFTCDQRLARDGVRIFNYVGSYVEPTDMEAMVYAPITMKKTLIDRLAREAENARAGRPAQVWAKMNSLIEPEVIDALYAAGQAGVRIDLVIRGICGLRPSVPGLSDNIRVKSVVGRFLEHSRIVCFGNGASLPSPQSEVYITSADWMDRNLNRRIETMVPITNETVRLQILEQVMAANLADEAHSWVLQPDGSYIRAQAPDGATPFNLHAFFMTNPSLSGRGERGADDAPRLRPSAESDGAALDVVALPAPTRLSAVAPRPGNGAAQGGYATLGAPAIEPPAAGSVREAAAIVADSRFRGPPAGQAEPSNGRRNGSASDRKTVDGHSTDGRPIDGRSIEGRAIDDAAIERAAGGAEASPPALGPGDAPADPSTASPFIGGAPSERGYR